jgi:hypothetical protein
MGLPAALHQQRTTNRSPGRLPAHPQTPPLPHRTPRPPTDLPRQQPCGSIQPPRPTALLAPPSALPVAAARPISPIAAERHRLKKRAWGHKTEHRLRVRAQIRTAFGVPLALARPAVHRGCRRPGVRHPAQARLATHRVPRLGLDLGPRVAREMIRPRRVIFPNSPAFGVAKLVTASVTSSGSGVRPVRAAHRRSSSPLR